MKAPQQWNIGNVQYSVYKSNFLIQILMTDTLKSNHTKWTIFLHGSASMLALYPKNRNLSFLSVIKPDYPHFTWHWMAPTDLASHIPSPLLNVLTVMHRIPGKKDGSSKKKKKRHLISAL